MKLLLVSKEWKPARGFHGLESSGFRPATLAWDTETVGEMFHPEFRITHVSWSWDGITGYVCTWDNLPPCILEWIEDPEIMKTGHNLKYDCKGMSLMLGRRIYSWPFRDTRHMWGLLDESSIDEDRASGKAYATIYPSLKVLGRRAGAERWTSPQDLFFEEKKTRKWADQPEEIITAYGAADAGYNWLLYMHLIKEMELADLQHADFLMQTDRTFIDIELDGFAMDEALLTRHWHQATDEVDARTVVLLSRSGMTTISGSSPQLGNYLYDSLGCPEVGRKTKAGRRPTDKKTLAKLVEDNHSPPLAKEFLTELLEVRKIEAVRKQCKTFLDAVCPDGRIHTQFNLSGTRTGRSSSGGKSDYWVNIQNPGRTGPVRGCFVSRFK